MAELELNEVEAQRLLSLVRTQNTVLRASGDWPERKIDVAIETKLISIDVERLKRSPEYLNAKAEVEDDVA
jgi:hypothetical protein